MKNTILPFFLLPSLAVAAQTVQHPNVLLIITDDQGFGDLSYSGNPYLKTTVIDNLARESVRFTNFYVCPVSAPTRAGLMTGRHFLRTGVRDTYNGGAIMAAGEITIAEMLKGSGYRTGIFGKWHLGDNYPCRPGDQGFDESVIHLSGGMGQVGDITTWFRGDSSYFDPVLWHNGKTRPFRGYCSDIFTDEAIRFIDNNRKTPFFCYLSFNAPHTPLQVPEEYYRQFKDIDPSAGLDKTGGRIPVMSEANKEDARKVYAMVKNIDDNIGRVLRKLDELGISKNTIVIFMTDNGPQQTRYNAGMRGLKSSVYRGGVRVPFFVRFPSSFKGNRDISETCVNTDIFPTIAGLCGATLPVDRIIDGRSMVPLLRGKNITWDDRALLFTWTRKYPELYNNIALQKGKYKLAGHVDHDAELTEFELFDIENDPFEQKNLVKENLSLAGELKAEMDKIFFELAASPNLTVPQRIIIGSSSENPLFLNRNDAAGDRGIWAQDEVFGFWRVDILEGRYNIRFRFLNPLKKGGQMMLEAGSYIIQSKNPEEGVLELEFSDVSLPAISCDLTPFYLVDSKKILPFWVEFERTDLPVPDKTIANADITGASPGLRSERPDFKK